MSERPTRTRPHRSETRQRVLAAAAEVFGQRGIAASSVSDVAAAAGLTKGAVYSSFTSKDELVLAMMEEHAMQRVVDALAGFERSDDPAAAVNTAGRALVAAIRSDAVWHRLLAEYFALSQHDPQRRADLRQRRRQTRESVAQSLDRIATNAGATLPMPASQFALVIFALSNGLGIESGIDPEAVSDDLIARVLTLLARDFIAQASR